ncbi:MAG: diguanylate cyclase [Bacillota bacterium]
MDSPAVLLQKYLNHFVHDPAHAVLDLQKLPEDFQEFGKSLLYFAECIMETGALAKAIAKGELSAALPPPSNEMAAPLKALHASLKHLTWQTQQVAKGDYGQRVDFMGDFSIAFNTMVEQLEQQRLMLLNHIHAMVQNRNLYEMLVGQIEQRIIVTDADTSKILFVSHEMDESLKDCENGLYRWLKRQTAAMKGKNAIHITELELPDSDAVLHYSVSIHPLRWSQHNALAFVLTDISSEKEQLQKLQNIANIDTLTQLCNRRGGMEVLEKWLSEGRSFVLCFIDIDNLKFVNDRYGHIEGDRYITCISDAMREFSPDAVVCRIGGDEFLLLAENWSLEVAAERLEMLRSRLIARNGPYERSVSYGIISVGPDNSLQASDLLIAADEKMYEYKRAYKFRQKSRTLQFKTEEHL